MSLPHDNCWEPLEGSADTLNALSKLLGVETAAHFEDVLAFDMVPTKASALILLYPTIEDLETYLKRRQPDVSTTNMAESRQVFFLRQLVGGTCGTIAAVHALANGNIISPNSSLINEFVRSEVHGGLALEAVMRRSKHLVDSVPIRSAHVAAANTTCQQRAAAAGQRQGRHFITFVHRNNILWQLNGRAHGPIRCGTTDAHTFVHDAITEIRRLLSATTDPMIHHSCSLVALVPLSNDS